MRRQLVDNTAPADGGGDDKDKATMGNEHGHGSDDDDEYTYTDTEPDCGTCTGPHSEGRRVSSSRTPDYPLTSPGSALYSSKKRKQYKYTTDWTADS